MERHSSNPLSHPEAFATGTLRRSGIRRHAPLVVGGCAVMLCRHGSAALRVNGNETLLSRGTMAFLVFDMTIVAGDVSPDFASEFFSIGFEATQQLFLAVTSSVFWDFIYVTPVLRLQKEEIRIISSWLDILSWIAANTPVQLAGTVFARQAADFLAILASITEEYAAQERPDAQIGKPWNIVNQFVGNLNRNYTRHHSVAYYAAALHVTPNYLNMLVRRHIGISAKKYIDSRLMLAAKTLLDTTDWSVKMIASRLGYDDPSYLCRLFRLHTGLSTRQYRDRQSVGS